MTEKKRYIPPKQKPVPVESWAAYYANETDAKNNVLSKVKIIRSKGRVQWP